MIITSMLRNVSTIRVTVPVHVQHGPRVRQHACDGQPMISSMCKHHAHQHAYEGAALQQT